MKLNKRAISRLSEKNVTGGFTTTINPFETLTACSMCCADTVDDQTCTFCTIA
ncbi:MAG: hypothetical protein AAF611_21975 [Bacteroidota bacterium]